MIGRRHIVLLVTAIAFTLHLSPSDLQAQDSVLRVDLPEGQCLELVWVEGGTFTMGSNEARGVDKRYESTRPEHTVTVADCYMGRFEVTQAQWRAVMGENPSHFKGDDSLPVEQVTWVDAQRFTTLLSQMTGHRFRLPTEAEWEYAARGGRRADGQPFAGCDRKQLPEYAWFCVNSDGHTHPVGRLKPNALGLHDMGGNVAEWCSDWMAPYTEGGQINPRGPQEGDSRILRGGHYNSTSPGCAVFDRGWYVPSGKTEYYGLRVVMEPDAPEPFTDVEERKMPEKTIDVEKQKVPEKTISFEKQKVPEKTIDVEKQRVPEKAIDVEKQRVPEKTIDVEKQKVPEKTISFEKQKVPEKITGMKERKMSEKKEVFNAIKR